MQQVKLSWNGQFVHCSVVTHFTNLAGILITVFNYLIWIWFPVFVIFRNLFWRIHCITDPWLFFTLREYSHLVNVARNSTISHMKQLGNKNMWPNWWTLLFFGTTNQHWKQHYWLGNACSTQVFLLAFSLYRKLKNWLQFTWAITLCLIKLYLQHEVIEEISRFSHFSWQFALTSNLL